MPGLHADMICGLLAGLVTAMVCSRARALRLPGWLRPLQEDLPGMLLSALACLLLVIPSPSSGRCWNRGHPARLRSAHHAIWRLLLRRAEPAADPLGLHQVLGSLIGLGESNLQTLSTAQPLHEGYVAGLYPVIMFGLPGACFAIWIHRQRMQQQLPQGGCCSPWRSPRHWWASRSPSSSCLPSPHPGCFWPMPC